MKSLVFQQADLETNQSINQSNFYSANIPALPGSVAQQPDQCSNAKSLKSFHNINRQ